MARQRAVSCAAGWHPIRFPRAIDFSAALPREDSGKIFVR
jgi:hypothetical protein